MKPYIGQNLYFYENQTQIDILSPARAIVTGVLDKANNNHQQYIVNIAVVRAGEVCHTERQILAFMEPGKERIVGCAYLIPSESTGENESEQKNYFNFKASAKVMRSYDYNHFEVAVTADVQTMEDVDKLRKDCSKLAEKAVNQFKQYKEFLEWKTDSQYKFKRLCNEVRSIKEIPESEWTPRQKSIVKLHSDVSFEMNREYNYDDYFEYNNYDEDWESWQDDHER